MPALILRGVLFVGGTVLGFIGGKGVSGLSRLFMWGGILFAIWFTQAFWMPYVKKALKG